MFAANKLSWSRAIHEFFWSMRKTFERGDGGVHFSEFSDEGLANSFKENYWIKKRTDKPIIEFGCHKISLDFNGFRWVSAGFGVIGSFINYQSNFAVFYNLFSILFTFTSMYV